jgi:uncharacterized alpha-E superfamily protein
VRAINRQARGIGAVSRDRLPADMIRLLDAPFPAKGSELDRAGSLQRRYYALAGMSAEHLGRTDAWRFHDLGRRVERAGAAIRAVLALGQTQATSDDLSTLLDVADSQISYRQRYLTGIARVPVLDLVALDPGNPRSIGFQVAAIADHLAKLPVLSDDGLAEAQQAQAAELGAIIATTQAASLNDARLVEIGNRLANLSDAISRRYFLQGAEPLRASGLVLA